MAQVHWLGAGLSAVPGIRRLIEQGRKVTLWNRTIEKAEAAVAGLEGDFDIRGFDLDSFEEALQAGDVAVSMLPGDFHPIIAKICLSKGANFVSSSYISPEMRDLDKIAKEKGLVLVNEVGLDPGIDHLMAHVLMDDYRNSDAFDKGNAVYFRSYCGGLSDVPNDFKYKFSWSPLGVLKALRSPSRSLRDGGEYNVARPWDAVEQFQAPLPTGTEAFEVYPNRDSYPYLEEYGFKDDWNVQQFVRGTLRYDGWAAAWDHLFREIETLEGEAGDRRMEEISEELWNKYAVTNGEADRVVLCVDLRAEKDGNTVYDKTYVMDALGDGKVTAMARLVSTPVSYAVEEVLDGKMTAGVHAAPSEPEKAAAWIKKLQDAGETMKLVNNL